MNEQHKLAAQNLACSEAKHNSASEKCLILIAHVIFLITLPFSICLSIKIVKEYEKGVVFRLGRVHKSVGPGVVILLPCIDRIRVLDTRTKSKCVNQEVLTKDCLPMKMESVVFYKVTNPVSALCDVSNYEGQIVSHAAADMQRKIGESNHRLVNQMQ